MRKDIILSGVGDREILYFIATIIGEAATAEGIQFGRQAEATRHQPARRRCAVQSCVCPNETIYLHLIAQGEADLIISMEPDGGVALSVLLAGEKVGRLLPRILSRTFPTIQKKWVSDEGFGDSSACGEAWK